MLVVGAVFGTGKRGKSVLESLPTAHRVVVWVLGLLAFAGLGGLLGSAMPVPLEWSTGAAAGLVPGVLAVWVFLYEINPEHHALGSPALPGRQR